MTSSVVDRGRLAVDLEHAIAGEVRFDEGSRDLYASDASVYRILPTGVVMPRTEDDIEAAVRVCREHHVPTFARGGRTGLAGQSVNTAVMFDFSKYMNRILFLDPGGGTPNRKRIALQMVKDMLDESSFDASPGHFIPEAIATPARKIADRVLGHRDSDH